MSNKEQNKFMYDETHCHELLTALPGVFAAGVRIKGKEIVEIHVLASSDRGAKQVVRDVQSALFAAYGVEVDHRIVSVAQMPMNPLEEKAAQKEKEERTCIHDVRLMITGVEVARRNGMVEIGVSLMKGSETFEGKATCRDTRRHYLRAAATATLDAVHAMLGKECFELLEVRQVNICDADILIAMIEFWHGGMCAPVMLTGASVQHDDAVSSVVRSTLDALNRCIGKLCAQCNG